MALATRAGEDYEEGDDEVFYDTENQIQPSSSKRNGISVNENAATVKTIDRYGFIIGSYNNATLT